MTAPEGLSQAEEDTFWMEKAIELAHFAESLGEIPVGALMVKDQQCISIGYNHSITTHDPAGHAEMMVLRSAGHYLHNYRLPNTTLYVTLEPCAMCATAMVHARVARLVFGTPDLKTGAAGSVYNLLNAHQLNHQVEIVSGVLAGSCSHQLSDFFKRRRQFKKQKRSGQSLN